MNIDDYTEHLIQEVWRNNLSIEEALQQQRMEIVRRVAECLSSRHDLEGTRCRRCGYDPNAWWENDGSPGEK
jgi:hypothetical protein